MIKNVIELIRVSTEGQAASDRAGIPAQRAANQRTAAQYELQIVRTIEITDVSGTAVLRSPGMQELLRLIESPKIHGVVAKEFSRLMRPENFADYALLQHFIDSATVLYLPDGPLDFASEAGKLLGGIRALIAGQERREMLRRLHDAKEAIRRAGRNAGAANVLPYGVGYSKDRGWHFTVEIEKVKRAFQMFLGGETSYQRIGSELNIPRQSVRYLMQNSIYTGWRVYDKRRDPSPEAYVPGPNGRQGYRRKMFRPADQVIRVRVLDAIIDEPEFARVQQIIETKRRRHWRSRQEAPNRYVYNGFLNCGDCGELIYTHAGADDFYVCKSRNPRERRQRALRGLTPCENKYMLRKKLEPKVEHVLGNMLCKPDFLARVVSGYNRSLRTSATATDQAVITATIHSLRGKRERVLETFFDGIIDKGERDRRVEEIDNETLAYERLLLQSAGPNKSDELDLDAARAIVEPFAEWALLGRTDKRKLLEALSPEIRVSRYEIKDLRLNLGAQRSDGYEGSHFREAASAPRGRDVRTPATRRGTGPRDARG
jgi:DNA invertase Pin-like site-specific DNA recombinase